ncbi:2-oxoglutarate ferredoxin oxidoreductase subunit gamma [Desulfonispora thiosulfatigenes DSM 11270]|uniref:2-oxoglutarate ferredoxin oxidoreductase subunit gamma n=1 Tax=Desulfonispora thiosulfatigenes DSM 11270 TaxID=656914 RepID=A0A1W1VP41_DESTI|nr:2-oxoacid:acceptor oxidoreductase family protein [Desulfonispora thiosulfatigenes]SMB95142.1 2-oxoglutarate ferredoxin oxidoreductase subunit gamma [Desulfonispora thiosulfatigenes DSM 11270]
MPNLIFAGFGGQGVLTAGLIVAQTAMNNEKNVTWIPSYGSEMRGGTANCNVKINDGKIASPFIKEIDILIAMNMPSVAKFESMVVPNGTIITNKSLIKDYNFRSDLKIVEVDATAIAEEASNPRGANIVMLGALAASGDLFDKDVMGSGVEEFFASKGRNNPKNTECFVKGFETSTVIKK